MADNEKREETTSRGNEWEVVSLTASTYAAAPGPNDVELKDDDKGNLVEEDKGETSQAMFMSGHFVFPPSQHENLPLEPKNAETYNDQGYEVDAPPDEGARSGTKDGENGNVSGLTESVDFEEDMALESLEGQNQVDKDQSIYHSAGLDEPTIAEEIRVIDEPTEHSDEEYSSDMSCLAKHVDNDDVTDGPDILPSEAWWKKRAASFYAHAKEANTFWSIFIAAAVMGLVIIGQHWQQERWQVLQHKFNDERMGKMLGPLSRFKDVIVGGTRRGSLIRGSTTSTQH